MSNLKPKVVIAGCLLCLGGQSFGNDDIKPVADAFINGSTLAFDYKGNFRNATISVAGPDGYTFSHFQKSGSPTLMLSPTGILADGLYKYQITVATNKKISLSNNLNNGRGSNAKTTMNVGESQSGSFRVIDGVIAADTSISEGDQDEKQ